MKPRICFLSLSFLALAGGAFAEGGYAQVATAGSGATERDGPKLYKALNMDLIFPKSFNTSVDLLQNTTDSINSDESFLFSGNPIDGPQNQQSSLASNDDKALKPDNYAEESVVQVKGSENTLSPPATGRAVDHRPSYSFTQLLTPNTKGYRPSEKPVRLRPRPVASQNSNVGPVQRPTAIVYPSYHAARTRSRAELDKLKGKGKFSDRFTPSEAVISNAFKKDRKPSASRLVGQPSNKMPSFVPSRDLYTFPPNTKSRYPSPTDLKQAAPSDTITSYLPPAAGPLDTSKFVGPVNPDLLPDSMKGVAPVEEAKDMASDNGGGYTYPVPQNQLEPNSGAMVDEKEPEPTAPAMEDDGDMDAPSPPDDSGVMGDDVTPPVFDQDHDHDHEIGGYSDDKEYPTPPPGYEEDHHHDHHHPTIDFVQGPYLSDPPHYYDSHHDHHHHLPDVVYDDYHDHFHHHDHIIEHHPVPMTTTEAPPPPPPPEPEQPRVKKYSYFYIGRKLWYIPLYFTLWFTFYVLWLILKSIARHKVNLPNHYVSRRSIDQMNHREAREAIDKLTVNVMDGIERFKLKYIG